MAGPHGIVFFALLLLFQVALTVWGWRRGASTATIFLVAFLPFIGVPYLLHRQRHAVRDNHIAGALTYVVLLLGAFFFLLWYPGMMEDDIPWALIHTMQFFGFLGLANLLMSPYGDG